MKQTINFFSLIAIAAIILLNISVKVQAQNNTQWSTTLNNGMGGNKFFEFGVGVAGKEPNAGRIGYQTITAGSLDIIGAGTLSTNRKIKFWNEGGAMFTGSVGVGIAAPTAILHLYGATSPNFKLSSSIANFEIGIASCNGCYATSAVPGDIVFRPSSSLYNKVIFYTNTSGGGRSFLFESSSGPILSIKDNQTVVIGNPSTITSQTPFPAGYNLFVTDGILTEKVKVSLKTTADWSDFVFDKDYKLMSLDSVATYIEVNKHLPDVPSAEEVVSNGIDLGKMDAKLLQKIEELTLYMIEMKKENKELKKEIEKLKYVQNK